MNEPILPEPPDSDVDTPMGNEAWTREQMREYARAAVLAERERCARLAEDMDFGMGAIAASIREGV